MASGYYLLDIANMTTQSSTFEMLCKPIHNQMTLHSISLMPIFVKAPIPRLLKLRGRFQNKDARTTHILPCWETSTCIWEIPLELQKFIAMRSHEILTMIKTTYP